MRPDHVRLSHQNASPLLVRLHRALSRLRSTVTVMHTGAHPDDEQSGLMALFRFSCGHRVVIACSTRGEGGQNALGPERTAALGVMRTREMEEAARILDADIHWLGHGPDDPVHDFGFSKDGDDTLSRWGEKTILDRLVRAYRIERPDVVIPTFLDVPGQHGHHRAMTRAAETAIGLAADPSYELDGLEPWQVAKYYLPAWSGGGGTYDDEVPPPASTLTIHADHPDAATGAAYDQIGEWSRAFHGSQGMGFWDATPQAEWPLHLKLGPATGTPEDALEQGLPETLVRLAETADLPYEARAALTAAQDGIDRAIAAFPKSDAIVSALTEAARQIETARAAIPAAIARQIDHRLSRKLAEIDRALIEAAGLAPMAWADTAELAPKATTTVHVQLPPGAPSAKISLQCTPGLSTDAGTSEGDAIAFALTVADDAPFTRPYPPLWSSLGGNGAVTAKVSAYFEGREAVALFDLVEPIAIGPAGAVALDPDAIVVRRGQQLAPHAIRAKTTGTIVPTLDVPKGWALQATDKGFSLTLPTDLAPGITTVPVLANGAPAYRKTTIAYPHIGTNALLAPENLRVLSLDFALPEGARVGYVGGGADRVGLWLARMGLNVTELTAEDLSGDLSGYTSIVVGIFAFGLRPDLAAATQKLHRWVEAGGHLLTLYHRPTDGWSPDATPLRRLVIGSPSLRWRVTDPEAHVEVLDPAHPLLVGPNPVGEADWSGWDKERGLYFAAEWAPDYVPLLAMHDTGEKPLEGALVSAKIGAGRHTHTSLVLHHQLDKLVPGAFRLLANLVQPA